MTAARPCGAARLALARSVAAAVPDPEIPVVTLADLGILRDVREEGGRVIVELTPTYTGCPATEVIRGDVAAALAEAGVRDAQVRIVLHPPWTTDWIGEDGRRKLREYGIAPPGPACGPDCSSKAQATATSTSPITIMRWLPPADEHPVQCPRCGSQDTQRISEHGSTPCKALHRCVSCREPFDYFKPY